MKCKRSRVFILVFMFILLVLSSVFARDEDLHKVWAIKDCKIVLKPGKVIEKGSIVIREGLIEAAGANIPVPPDAEIIDGAKLTVYAGLIDTLGDTLLKMPEEKIDRGKIYSGEYTDKDRGITPESKAFDYVNLTKATISKYHKLGITGVVVLPQRGIFTGQASFFTLGDTDKNKAVVLKDNWLGIGFSAASMADYPDSLMGVVAYLKQEFLDLGRFLLHKSRWQKEMNGIQRPEHSEKYEILSQYYTDGKPVVFFCRNRYDISRAIKIGNEFKLNYIICDLGGEAFRTIPELKKTKAPILVTLAFKAPSTSIFAQTGKDARAEAEKEVYPANAAKLAEAAIPFAFSSMGTNEPDKFIASVRTAIEKGLPADKALAALTIDAASILGVQKALGTIEPGKIANLIVSENDIFSKEPKIRYVFVDGRKTDLKEKKAEAEEKPTVNVTGKWEISVESGMGAMKLTLELHQEESELSGRYTSQYGQYDFADGTVSGNQINFNVTFSAGTREIDIYVTGTVEGDSVSGSLVFGGRGSSEFTGRRIP